MAELYSDTFYNYIEEGSKAAADAVIAAFRQAGLNPRSVLDVGCGRGAWLARWQGSGVEEVFGLDGGHVDQSKLLIPQSCFSAQDLTLPFERRKRYGLVQSLEVAEHLPLESASGFVRSLVAHGDLVLFSAAVPGQGGEHHLNEQPLEYWRGLFEAEGYLPVDLVRPFIRNMKAVPPWYRFNTVLYVKADQFDSLPEFVRACRVASDERIKELGDLAWKVRTKVFGLLPIGLITKLSILHHRVRAILCA